MRKLISKVKQLFKSESIEKKCVIKRNECGSYSIYLSIDPEIRVGRFATIEDARRVAVSYNFMKVEDVCE